MAADGASENGETDFSMRTVVTASAIGTTIEFMSWGWRLPFLGSAVLVAVGTFIRLRTEETPDFRRTVREGHIARFPVLDTIRRHPKDLCIGLGARITEVSWVYVITIFGLSYAVTNMALPRSLVLGAIAAGAAGELITIPVFGALSDRIGRRPVYMLGCLMAIILSFPIFWAIQTRDPSTVVLGFVIGMSMGHGIMYGVQASFLSEMFPSNLRYSGASLGTHDRPCPGYDGGRAVRQGNRPRGYENPGAN
jgi:MHS family shikimate/dehydroshikimate transporter-like MFS transporter